MSDLPWGAAFKDLDFYNLTGFHLRLLPDHSPLVHLQFWTAARGVDCGVHRHTDAIFAEVHVSLSAGTGDGGMWRLKSQYNDVDPGKMGGLGRECYDVLALRQLDEHGGMWFRDEEGEMVRRRKSDGTVVYPWHKWQAGGGDEGVDVWMAVEFFV